MEINAHTNGDDEDTSLKKELRAVAMYLTDEVIADELDDTVDSGRAHEIEDSFEQLMRAFHSLENALTGECKPYDPAEVDRDDVDAEDILDEVFHTDGQRHERRAIDEATHSDAAMQEVIENGPIHVHMQKSPLAAFREALNEYEIENLDRGDTIAMGAQNMQTGEEINFIELVVENDDPDEPVIYQHDKS